jgi:hypothetical protein
LRAAVFAAGLVVFFAALAAFLAGFFTATSE